MALINCPECKKDISDKAASCPHCGCPVNPQPICQEEYVCCPKCNSRELHAEHKGFSGGKALAGAIVTGGIGLLAGTIGSRDTQITCLKCGHKFKAGEEKVVIPSNDQAAIEEKIVKVAQDNGPLYAVKWYKDRTGSGLAEAKEYVDSVLSKHNITPASGNSGQGCLLPIVMVVASTVSLLFLF